MGRKRLSPEEKKVTITFRFKQKLIDAIKATENYNKEVEETLNDKFNKKE